MSRRRAVDLGLDALTWLVLLVMLAPVIWLVVSSLQDDLELATGAYDLFHPTFDASPGCGARSTSSASSSTAC